MKFHFSVQNIYVVTDEYLYEVEASSKEQAKELFKLAFESKDPDAKLQYLQDVRELDCDLVNQTLVSIKNMDTEEVEDLIDNHYEF